MAQVAKEAGVSASTVCRALSSNPQIPPATRERVRAVAARMGYQADPLLSALASRRRGKSIVPEATTIAYITNFQSSNEWQENPYYRRLFEGASGRASHLGYRLEHFWLKEPGLSGQRASRILYSRGISAVVVPPTPGVRGHLALDWGRFSSIAIGYSLLRPNLHRTSTHHFHGILMVVRELRRLGYRRIGFCVFKETSKRVDEQWISGILLCQKQLRNIALSYLVFDDHSVRGIPDWCREKSLEVVIGADPAVFNILRKSGLFPRRIDYATISWNGTQPEIAGLDQRPEETGATAVDLVVSQLQRGERGIPRVPFTTMIEGVWMFGPSLRRLPAGS